MRGALKQIHLWLGLTLGFFWALQGLTGACLVFHDTFERLTVPGPTGGTVAPIRAVLRNAEPELHGGRINRITLTDEHSDLIEVSYIDQRGQARALLMDAATARVFDQRDLEPLTPFTGSVVNWLLYTHTKLLSGSTGQALVGTSGLVLLTTVIAGLWLAWPSRGGWKWVYAWHLWRTRLQWLYGLHRALGLTAAAFILFSALSGAWLAFADELRPALARVVPHQVPYHPRTVASLETGVSADQALANARARLPQARWARVTLPTAKSPVYTIRFHQPEEGAWLGRTSVAVDAATGRIESVYDSTAAPLSNRIVDTLLPLHNGEQFGLPSQAVLVLVGLSLPTLYTTALWRWLAQRRRRALALRPS